MNFLENINGQWYTTDDLRAIFQQQTGLSGKDLDHTQLKNYILYLMGER